MVKILFLGNKTGYSEQVKTALKKAGYEIASRGLVVSAAYGKKLPAGGLNLHPSLLPAYRGATPVPHQILDGVTQSGITIIKMAEQFDAGPIVAQEPVPVLPEDTSLDLLNRCFAAGAMLLIKILPDYLSARLVPKPQPENSPTPYCRRFTKEDGFISWDEFKDSLKIENCKLKIERATRAFFPWPGVWTKMPNNKTLKLLPKNLFQLEGKQPITKPQFLAGYGHLLP